MICILRIKHILKSQKSYVQSATERKPCTSGTQLNRPGWTSNFHFDSRKLFCLALQLHLAEGWKVTGACCLLESVTEGLLSPVYLCRFCFMYKQHKTKKSTSSTSPRAKHARPPRKGTIQYLIKPKNISLWFNLESHFKANRRSHAEFHKKTHANSITISILASA